MKTWRIHTFGIDSLSLDEVPSPKPGPGQVLIAVKAVSLNYRDLMMVKGMYNPKLQTPRIPCSDGAGTVAEVGEGVSSLKVGDRVAGIFMQNWLDGEPSAAKYKGALGGDIDGMLSEFVVLPESGVVRVPVHSVAGGISNVTLCRPHCLERPHARLGHQARATPCWSRGPEASPSLPCSSPKPSAPGYSAPPAAMRSWPVPQDLGSRLPGFNYRSTPDWDKWAVSPRPMASASIS